jgi:hypothetical protein
MQLSYSAAVALKEGVWQLAERLSFSVLSIFLSPDR